MDPGSRHDRRSLDRAWACISAGGPYRHWTPIPALDWLCNRGCPCAEGLRHIIRSKSAARLHQCLADHLWVYWCVGAVLFWHAHLSCSFLLLASGQEPGAYHSNWLHGGIRADRRLVVVHGDLSVPQPVVRSEGL